MVEHLEIDKKFICLKPNPLSASLATFKFTGAKHWNELPNELRVDGLTLGSFKRKTFKYLQEQDKI